MIQPKAPKHPFQVHLNKGNAMEVTYRESECPFPEALEQNHRFR